jgi:hypothetical protein
MARMSPSNTGFLSSRGQCVGQARSQPGGDTRAHSLGTCVRPHKGLGSRPQPCENLRRCNKSTPTPFVPTPFVSFPNSFHFHSWSGVSRLHGISPIIMSAYQQLSPPGCQRQGPKGRCVACPGYPPRGSSRCQFHHTRPTHPHGGELHLRP